MKIVVTGAAGQLGTSVVKRLRLENQVYAYDSRQLDITNEQLVYKVLEEIRPTHIINCAAYNNVNKAEQDIKEADSINEMGTYNLAKGAEAFKATLIHISTDYVFDGEKKQPYIEEDIPNPLNVYGKSKYRGELHVMKECTRYMIIRTSWLYSYKSNNFLSTILRLAKERESIDVICDHYGTPTFTEELAIMIEKLIEVGGQGLYHCSGQGSCTWYEFAKEIVKLAKIDCEVRPILAKDYKEKARKPSYSVLDNAKIEDETGFYMKPWQETLTDFFKFYKV